MGRMLKSVAPYWKSVIIIMALLFLQAFCDLSLPQYTSDIIDNGIQNGGVSHSMPESITKEEYETAKIFMTDEELDIWESSYDYNNETGIYNLNVKSEKSLINMMILCQWL